MLRPLVATAAVTAAAVLLTACGGDDKKPDTKPQGGESSSSSTPSAKPVASFDPPKSFVPVSAYGVSRSAPDNRYSLAAGMVGQSSLISGLTGITGRNIAAEREAWTVPAAAAATTTVMDKTDPMPLQLDGKDVVGVAYVQAVAGSGTQKSKGQVLFQWIDATDGKKVAEVAADLTPLLGPGETGEDMAAFGYDATTGQLVVGVHPLHPTAKSGGILTVFADPKTQKSSLIPTLEPTGVLNGVIAGVNGGDALGHGEATILIADAATGKITKTFPTKQAHLEGAGHGVKHAYMSGGGATGEILYSVDIATGAITTIKPVVQPGEQDFTCLGDEAEAVVCTDGPNPREIIGIDDTTGKRSWGYTDRDMNRVVPSVTAAFHGIIYGQTETQPALLDAATGNDVPVPSPTPSAGTSPAESATPVDGSTPSDPITANGSEFSLFNGTPKSPSAVSKYGGAYLQDTGDASYQTVLIAMSATA